MEEFEAQQLAPYAIKSKDSKGRGFPEEEADFRTRFQRDRERILHTTAFRRLEYKTQVFINNEGDYYRTRLTHSLEVAQLGRSVARSLGANEDLVETICLAHDLGHPPFGHSGETALAKLMLDHGGFNHNAHSLRIVTELERRYPDFPGLNLSYEVLEGMVKHETDYDISDAKDYDPNLRGSLEAQIANVADELAYTSHDLDDGLRSGMITPSQLDGIALWEIIIESLGRRKSETLDELTRHQIIRRLIGFETTDLTQSIDRYLRKSNVKSALELQKLAYNVVGFSEDMFRRNRELKDFLFNNLYRHYRVVRMASKAEKIVSDLFTIYQKIPATLPSHIQTSIRERGLERSICDYIAGMTDRFAIDEYNRLFTPDVLP
ncbi:MAG TPA: deoxyguanosinetriphosphate triphosphohydrolase [Anaerolineaceae bacterium]|nr:deoxyguanosinetriphosphate triphosphohydrolase [Anaerolineaceae bacterium]